MELSAAERIFETLDGAGVEYLVVGGLAVNAHGYVRMTVDIGRPQDLADIAALEGLSDE